MGVMLKKRMPQEHKFAQVSKRGVRQRTPQQGSGQAYSAAGKRQEKPYSNQSGPQSPAFTRCTLVGPDGTERPGWEMWVGEALFGRADSKESLLQYYARLHEPMPSGHWKERSWYARRSNHTKFREEEKEDETFELGETLDNELELQPWG
jgi:hypothetical protein